MRHTVVRWFVFCILLTGLQARIVAVDPCEVTARIHAGNHCHVDHDGCPPGDSDHDEKCPVEHHSHQGICGHATPFAADVDAAIRLTVTESSGLRLRHKGVVLPDGPCLEMESPPII